MDVNKIKEKIKKDGVISLTNEELTELRTSINNRMLNKSERINKTLSTAFSERNFTLFEEGCTKLDLQYYYNPENIASIGYQSGKPIIEIKLQMYSANKEAFEPMIYRAKLLEKGFKITVCNFGERYNYIKMVIGRIFNETNLLAIIKEELRLEPLFFFFIIKSDKVQPKFDVQFQNEAWAYSTFMAQGHAEVYYEMLEKSIIKGEDFVAACWDGAPWSEEYFNPTLNDWISFEVIDERLFASYVGG